MTQKKRFNFIEKTNWDGETSLVPYLPLKLVNKDYSLKTLGLLDTGASVNVLPYQLGLELGLNWENLNIIVSLTGNLAQFPAKGVILKVEIETFSSVLLAFAWTQSNLELSGVYDEQKIFYSKFRNEKTSC